MITADATTLMRQAPMTAQMYLSQAVDCIDNQFGPGYAKAHPDLVAAFMQVSGQDFTMAILAQAINEAAEEIARAVANLSA
jgi:hypothetical protein